MATLGDQAVGSIVKLNVSGAAKEFIVVHQGKPSTMYDSSCDGTWLLMKDIYTKLAWTTSTTTSALDSTNHHYGTSPVHSAINDTLYNEFDAELRDVMQQVKIPYVKGAGKTGTVQTGSNGLSAKMFLLSAKEVGYSKDTVPSDGATLAYFNGATKNTWTAYYNGTKTSWWTRSPVVSSTSDATVWQAGADSGSGMLTTQSRTVCGVRPAVIMSKECEVDSDGFVTTSSGSINGSVNIGGVQRELTGSGYINIGGVLHELSDAKVNIGGAIKSLKG